MALTPLPADKASHALVGALAYLTAAAICAIADPGANRILAGLVFAGALGVAKEAGDWLGNRLAMRAGLPSEHGVELADAAWTLAGGALVAMGAVIGGAS